MIKKWDVAPAPNEKNPGRHKLLIKGEMKDIFLIVKKLGSVCSRPEKTSGEFDFIIYLSELEIETMKKLKASVQKRRVRRASKPVRPGRSGRATNSIFITGRPTKNATAGKARTKISAPSAA